MGPTLGIEYGKAFLPDTCFACMLPYDCYFVVFRLTICHLHPQDGMTSRLITAAFLVEIQLSCNMPIPDN